MQIVMPFQQPFLWVKRDGQAVLLNWQLGTPYAHPKFRWACPIELRLLEYCPELYGDSSLVACLMALRLGYSQLLRAIDAGERIYLPEVPIFGSPTSLVTRESLQALFEFAPLVHVPQTEQAPWSLTNQDSEVPNADSTNLPILEDELLWVRSDSTKVTIQWRQGAPREISQGNWACGVEIVGVSPYQEVTAASSLLAGVAAYRFGYTQLLELIDAGAILTFTDGSGLLTHERFQEVFEFGPIKPPKKK